MNKAHLLKTIRVNASITNVESEAFLKSFINIIKQQSVKGNEVKISGFGKFKIIKYKQRSITAPNGKTILIKEHNIVRFVAFTELNKAIFT